MTIYILTLGILFSFISFCFIGRNKFGNAIVLANERKYYTSPRTNLLTSKLQYQPPFNSKEVKCDKVLECGGGALHLPLIVYADDKKYIYVDYMGLATPFCTYYGKNYGITGDRPGHFKINISLLNSQGYEESLIKNKNLISDKGAKLLFDDVNLISKGNLFSKKRFNAIIRLHTIRYNKIK